MLTPYDIAFPSTQKENKLYAASLILVDIFFFIDILITFFSAYLNDDEKVVDNHKNIAQNYVKSWFFIDIFSIIPID